MISKLDYIQGMGFDTVWISPIIQNIGGTTAQGEAFHGYWPLDNDKLVSDGVNISMGYEVWMVMNGKARVSRVPREDLGSQMPHGNSMLGYDPLDGWTVECQR